MRDILAAAVVLSGSLAGCASQETRVVQGVSIVEDKVGLWKQATFPVDSAVSIARARVAGGRITKAELETEDDRLIYSFDLTVDGKSGIDEVHVDARSGAVVSVKHESR